MLSLQFMRDCVTIFLSEASFYDEHRAAVCRGERSMRSLKEKRHICTRYEVMHSLPSLCIFFLSSTVVKIVDSSVSGRHCTELKVGWEFYSNVFFENVELLRRNNDTVENEQ